jgi:hypothetical protein
LTYGLKGSSVPPLEGRGWGHGYARVSTTLSMSDVPKRLWRPSRPVISSVPGGCGPSAATTQGRKARAPSRPGQLSFACTKSAQSA